MTTTNYDLEAAFESDAALEQLWAQGGTLATLLEQLGAYQHHPTEQTDFHEQRAYGYPTANLRKDRISFTHALPFEAYRHLIPCGPKVRALIAKHPSTPADVRASFAAMGQSRTPLAVTSLELGTRPTRRAPPPPAVRPAIDHGVLDQLLSKCAAQEGGPDVYSGPEGTFLQRVGALHFEWEVYDGEEEWNDWNGARVGSGPRYRKEMGPALDRTLPYSDYDFLLGRGHFGRQLVAGHPSTPTDVLLRLGASSEPTVRRAIANRQCATDIAVLELLAGDEDMRRALARNPYTPLPILHRLAPSAPWEAIVENPASDAFVLRELAKRFASVPKNYQETAKWRVAEHRNTPTDVLEALLAENPHENLQKVLRKKLGRD